MTTLPAENLKSVPLPKNTMIVARQDGRLYIVDFTLNPFIEGSSDVDWSISGAKIILGKIQHTRVRYLSMDEVVLENVIPSDNFNVTLFSSLDGKNISNSTVLVPAESDGQYVKFNARKTAQNFSVQVSGVYNLNTLAVTFHNAGRR